MQVGTRIWQICTSSKMMLATFEERAHAYYMLTIYRSIKVKQVREYANMESIINLVFKATILWTPGGPKCLKYGFRLWTFFWAGFQGQAS